MAQLVKGNMESELPSDRWNVVIQELVVDQEVGYYYFSDESFLFVVEFEGSWTSRARLRWAIVVYDRRCRHDFEADGGELDAEWLGFEKIGEDEDGEPIYHDKVLGAGLGMDATGIDVDGQPHIDARGEPRGVFATFESGVWESLMSF